MFFKLDPKKFSDYTPETAVDGSEVVPIVKEGQNTTVPLSTIWESDPTPRGSVDSVNGRTRVVVLDTGDISEVADHHFVTDAEKAELAALPADLSAKASQADLAAHETNTSNPHTVTKTQVGLSAVPNVDATNRSNHIGTQPSSTISDFSSAASAVADMRVAAAAGSSVASLTGGKVPTSQLPAVALTSVQTAVSQAAMLALTTEEGDVVVRTDESKTYMRNAGSSGTMADFTLLDTPIAGVTSVNGQEGTVVLGAADVGAATEDEVVFAQGTADGAFSAAGSAQTDINTHVDAVDNPHHVTAAQVGLDQVDNTSDLDKPISTATQAALDVKQAADSDLTAIAALDSTVAGALVTDGSGWIRKTYAQLKTALSLTKSDVGLGNVDNTSDATKNSAAVTLTNKRIQKRVFAAASVSTLTPEVDTYDCFTLTAQAAALTVANQSSSSPADFAKIEIRILDNGTARAISYGTNYAAGGVSLPSTTVVNKLLTLGFEWNSSKSKWYLIAATQEV